MATTKLSDSGTRGNKYENLSADNNYMETIASTLVGSGGATSITFSNIPQGYKDLQIRTLGRSQRSASQADELYMQINSTSLTRNHYFLGTGSSALSGSATAGWAGIQAASSSTAGVFGASIIDILDYANVNKNKTTRSLSGLVTTNSEMYLLSNFIANTAPITSLTFTCSGSNSFAQNTRISLYGIKG